jgi:hypothetical protein
MAYKTETTAANFPKRCTGVITSGKSIRDNIHDLAKYAIGEYLNPARSGDLSDLTRLIQAVDASKALSTTRFAIWLEDAVNVKCARNKDGEMTVRKAEKGQEPAVLDPAVFGAYWYEYGRPPANNPVDIVGAINKLLKSIESTQGEAPKKKLKDGQQCAVDHAVTALMGLRARVESDITRAEMEAMDNVEAIDAAA